MAEVLRNLAEVAMILDRMSQPFVDTDEAVVEEPRDTYDAVDGITYL